MVSPETLRAVLDDETAKNLSQEGGHVPAGPKRFGWFKWLIVLGVVASGVFVWRFVGGGPSPPAAKVGPVSGRPLGPTSRPMVQEDMSSLVDVLWVCNQQAGVTVDGVNYVVSPGDVVGGVSFGLVGLRWIDVSVGGRAGRAYARAGIGSDGSGAGHGSHSGASKVDGKKSASGKSGASGGGWVK